MIRGLSRRDVLRGVAGIAGGALGARPRPVAATTAWDQVVAAARKEGKLAVNTFTGQGYARVFKLFTQAYPDIKLDHTTSSPPTSRRASSRSAGPASTPGTSRPSPPAPRCTTEPVLSRDRNQLSEFMVRGRYPIGIGLNVLAIQDFQAHRVGRNVKTQTNSRFVGVEPGNPDAVVPVGLSLAQIDAEEMLRR
jgi:hypothetical protein